MKISINDFMNLSLVFLPLILIVGVATRRLYGNSREDVVDVDAERRRSNDPHEYKNKDYPHMGSSKPKKQYEPKPDYVTTSGMKRIPPIFTTEYSSPLVADVGSDPNEGGIVLTQNVTDYGSDRGSVGIYLPPSEHRQPRSKLITLHHMIHHAKDEALKAKEESSAAQYRANALLAYNQELKAKIKSNEAEMLQEEEQRLVEQRKNKPQILVKDVIPIADVANNILSFEHHNELLKKENSV